ncbi:MAG TPA: hypothetical protein VGJ12_05975 [Gemmatimonadaceae bacterium]
MRQIPLTIPLAVPRGAFTSIATLSATLLALAGCAKHDNSAATQDSTASSSSSTSTATTAPDTSSAAPADITPVRGSLASVSDSAITVTTSTGDVHIVVQPPLRVFGRASAKLSDVKPSSFVGVTSVAQPDGSQRATEIHIFPEELRGTGEGSYLMTPKGGADSSQKKSTMTNGTVSAAPKAGGPPRMTNGTIASQNTGKITVNYRGGSQTITVPPNVSVTSLAPVSTKLSKGTRVVVLGLKQPDGTMKASNLVVADSTKGKK